MKRGLWIIGVIFSLCVFVAPALAAPVLDFGTGAAGSGGTLTYDGTNVVASGIPVDVLLVSGAPLNNGVWDLSGAFPNGVNGTAAELSFNTGTGEISVIGGVTFSQSETIPDTTTLMTGTIQGFNVLQSGIFLSVSELTGVDEKDELLLAALGLPTNAAFTFLGFNISGMIQEGENPQYTAYSTDIVNTPVPIPSAILLMGGGLAGLAVFRRRLRV